MSARALMHPAPVAGHRPLHVICELARAAACSCCPASGTAWPCVRSFGTEGFHLSRFADARRRGLITAADFSTVTDTLTVIANSAIIYDDTFGVAA